MFPRHTLEILPGNITGVVWTDPGATTHNYAIGHRSQLLPFKVSSSSPNGTSAALTVTAPGDPNQAPPGFYLVFLVSGDLYSDAIWVQIREPAPKPLPGVVAPEAKLVKALSSNFSADNPGELQFKLVEGGGGAGTSLQPALRAAAGAGSGGLRIKFDTRKPNVHARLLSNAAWLSGGKNCTLMLWARGGAAGQTVDVSVVPEDGNSKPLLAPTPLRLQTDAHCLFTLPVFTPEKGGNFQIALKIDMSPSKPLVDIDDVELYCLP